MLQTKAGRNETREARQAVDGGQSRSPAQRHCVLLLTPHLLFQVAAYITCASAEARAEAELQAADLVRAVQSRT